MIKTFFAAIWCFKGVNKQFVGSLAYYMMLSTGILGTGKFEEEIKITIRLN